MVNKERQDLKEGCIDSDKPATIHIDVSQDDTWTIDATHHIISPETGVVSIYEGPRSAGIDVQTHISRCVIDRRTSADTGASEAVNDNETPRVMTDGGQDISDRRDVEPDVRPGAEPREPVNVDTSPLANPTMWRVRLGPFPIRTDENDPYDEYDPVTDGCDKCDDQEIVTDGGRDIGPDSDDVVTVEAPITRFAGPRPKFQTVIYVSVGAAVVLDNHVCRVTAVRKATDSDGTQDAEIDIEGLVVEATIRDGIWRCQECDRVSVEPRGDSPSTHRCSICRSEAKRESRRRRREEWEQELEDAILTDPADTMTGAMKGVPEWREELNNGDGE